MGAGWLKGRGVGVRVGLRNTTSRSDFPFYSQISLKCFI
jgi:hypothetical protein